MSHLANCLHYKPLKLKLKVFLSACTIAMVTYCAMKEAFFCSAVLEHLFDTITRNSTTDPSKNKWLNRYAHKVHKVHKVLDQQLQVISIIFFFCDRRHFYQTITKVSVSVFLCCLLNDLFAE